MRRLLLWTLVPAALAGSVCMMRSGTIPIPAGAAFLALHSMDVMTAESRNAEIHFYGRVVDEEGKGVSGASIFLNEEHFSSGRAMNSLSPSVEESKKLTTDATGDFEVQGRGVALHLESIGKSGFRAERIDSRDLNFSPSFGAVVETSASHRRVFRLMRSRNVMQTRGFRFRASVAEVSDRTWGVSLGRTCNMKELEGVEAADAAFTIRVRRPQCGTGEWVLSVKAVDGGVVMSDEAEWLKIAPTAGYIPEVEVRKRITEGHRSLHLVLYLRRDSGKEMARVEVTVGLPRMEGEAVEVKVEGEINGDGSRDFQTH